MIIWGQFSRATVEQSVNRSGRNGRVTFFGKDGSGPGAETFHCKVNGGDNSALFDVAVHAATNFKNGTYLEVMRHRDEPTKCFYIKLINESKYYLGD